MAEFEWDPAKAASNLATHGVSFEEASTSFDDPLGGIVDDPRHSVSEARYILLAMSDRGRLLATMFTERGDVIRIVSARRATRAERHSYEERSR